MPVSHYYKIPCCVYGPDESIQLNSVRAVIPDHISVTAALFLSHVSKFALASINTQHQTMNPSTVML